MNSKDISIKMSITILADYFVPENKAISIRMKYLAEALMDEGFAVTIRTSKGSKNISGFTVKTNWLNAASNKDALFLRLIKELLFSAETFFRILFSKSDLYIITSPPFTLAFFSALAVTIKGRKFILDVRDEYPEAFFSEKLISATSLPGRILLLVERWMYRKALIISTVTNRILEKIKLKTTDKNKIWLFRNGYAEGIEPGQNGFPTPFKVMFHGTMGKFQHPDLILSLAQRCHQEGRNIHFQIFGSGTHTDLLQRKKLPNLEHMGEISHNEMKEIISTAHVGVSFQKEDEIARNSFPSKIYEFIGAGVPTLITPISEAGEFVENHKIGFQFSPDRIDDIFQKLVFLEENPDELQRMRENARQIRTRFSRTSISWNFARRLREHLFYNAEKKYAGTL